ncbi:hypothetical protein SSX86_029588 [Deinandra increscens subsp. villosa]|uniref:DUF4216 domain-containing protein n=1 Tax=Deinandra increscens subsp. villosa TaxID=3103831 RepID=A0AAP0CGI3_9ASTR
MFHDEDDMEGLVRDAFGVTSSPLNNEELRDYEVQGDIGETSGINPHSQRCDNGAESDRWLEPNHISRSQMDRFDGTIEEGGPPSVLTGSEILKQTSDGKSKDNENSRKDLMKKGIRHELHLIEQPNKKLYLPPACYTMSNVEKRNFLQVLKDLKVPDGYLMRLKSYVRNKAQPEGSIAEGYIKDECITFCSRYFEGVETSFNRPPRNNENTYRLDMYMLNSGGRKLGKVEDVELDSKSLAQAHRYVLLNHPKIQPLRGRFMDEMQALRNERMDKKIMEKLLVEEFSCWLHQKAPLLKKNKSDEEVLSLVVGPSTHVKMCKGFITNGFRFLTKRCEEFRKTQNSGVFVQAVGGNYYGKLTEIIELEYSCNYKVVLFRCDWVDIRPSRGLKKDKYGFPLVNFSKPLAHTGEALKDDPFIISSQARQVFYIEDVKDVGWSHVIMTKPRDTYDMGSNISTNDEDEVYTQCIPSDLPVFDDVSVPPRLRRIDMEIDDE